MSIEMGKPSDFRNAKKMAELFPNLGNGFENGLSLRELASKVRKHKDKPFFEKYAVETVAKYVRFALVGGSFRGEELEGLLGEDKCREINSNKIRNGAGLKKIKDVNGYTNWSNVEEEFVLKWYSRGKSPKEIFRQYSNMQDFSNRTYISIRSFLDLKRKEGVIGKQRIEWEGDIGFFACALLQRYGGGIDNYKKNVDTLNEYFFTGEQIITYSKLHNFYNRETRKYKKELLEDKIAA